jgi:sortase A
MAKTTSSRRRPCRRWPERLLLTIGLICLGTALATVAEGRLFQLLGRWQLGLFDPANAVAEHTGSAGAWLGREVSARWDSPVVWAAGDLVEAGADLPWSRWRDAAAATLAAASDQLPLEAWRSWAEDLLPEPRQPRAPSPEAPAEDPAPAVAPGSPLGTIAIPEVGLDAVILEGIGADVLRRGVGHFPRAPMPGAGGNSALAGHRDTFFRSLRQVAVGQRVVITTADRRQLVYRVASTEVVEPTRVDVVDDVGQEALTLITCYPFTYVGPAPRRFVVRCLPDAGL